MSNQRETNVNSTVELKRVKFSFDEDCRLCRGWSNDSQDPIAGNSQKLHYFWGKVETYFDESYTPNDIMPENFRDKRSLENRFASIKLSVSKFVGY